MSVSLQQTVLRLSPYAATDELVERALDLAADRTGRVALGLAGGPGVGKSTLAGEVVARLNRAHPGLAAPVPMDGFHMRHEKLEALGTAKDKGAPHTFEAAAFAAFLSRLKTATAPVSGPGYSRKIEDVIEDAFIVLPEVRVLVVEGNYLLLPDRPWAEIKPQLDLAVFLHVPRDLVRERLLKRHAAGGLFTEQRNIGHVDGVDLVNYDLVERCRSNADLVFELLTER